MTQWKPLEIKAELLENVDEAILDDDTAAIENCYVTKKGSLSRFPRLATLIDLPGNQRTYLRSYRGDLHAVSGGYTYRINIDDKTSEDMTDFTVGGGGRVIFAETESELVMAAGGDIAKLSGAKTEKLSDEAPQSTHVVYIDGYLIGIEALSGRFRNSQNRQYDTWNALDVFSAEGNPDNIVAAVATEFSELMLAGTASIEQFDSSPQGSSPFFRRWVLGAGLLEDAKYTLLAVDNRLWGINQDREWVNFNYQIGNVESENIQASLDDLDDFKDGWSSELVIKGQRFIILQFPYATNRYGTQGLTFLYDYRKRRWGNLYGWDEKLSLPSRWPGWSVAKIGKRVFVGGDGVIYELGGTDEGPTKQRMIWRSGHLSRTGGAPMSVEQVTMRVKRGVGTYTKAPIISLRANKDNRGFGRWVRRTLGKAGDREMILRFPKIGNCDTIQFEIDITDAADVQISKMWLDYDRLAR